MSERILWLDLETTGLNPEEDLILEIGCWLTTGVTEGLVAIDSFTASIYPPNGEDDLDVMDEVVRDMHRASGLWVDVLDNGTDIDLVEDDLLLWLGDNDLTGDILVGGSGIDRFDIPLMRNHFPRVEALFHWRTMDVSSMKMLLKDIGLGGLVPEPVAEHRALADAAWAADVCKNLTAYLTEARKLGEN